MSNLETAMTKLDAAGLTEGETQAVADYLLAALSQEDTGGAEVSGFGFDQKPKGLLLGVSSAMRPGASGFTVTLTQSRVQTAPDSTQAKGFSFGVER